ncbi:hypothetical protein MKW94_028484 [Papaver nudicaule]|uniref:25S rRNA (uridine-N(3))-methyltransferase BMT5-like domain-containing protein n=1 Tax=Papaver nudicaule TaxID=74823 RepID=A0AA41RV15_PAPNU|nr:hypothetical protein [Papaver nudicaule]
MEGGTEVKWIKHYSSSHKILLVGEGDFSFSTCLARAFGTARNMVATSLDSEPTILHYYSNGRRNLDELKSQGCTVMYSIDATKMAQDSNLLQHKFDRIVFNFPYEQLFFENAKKLIVVNGEILVTHKTNSFHCEWDLQGLASSSGLRLIEQAGFMLSDYPGYDIKYGFNYTHMDSSFECQPSSTFKFGHA